MNPGAKDMKSEPTMSETTPADLRRQLAATNHQYRIQLTKANELSAESDQWNAKLAERDKIIVELREQIRELITDNGNLKRLLGSVASQPDDASPANPPEARKE